MIRLISKANFLKHPLSNLNSTLISASLAHAKVTSLTDIQRMAVDAGILEGKKMLLHSESGSGKTLAYLMPILESMYKLDNLTDMRVQMDK